MKPLILYLLALLAGAVYPFGFAPFSYWPLAMLSVAVLFYLLLSQRLSGHDGAGRSALIGLMYGLGSFGVGVSWVTNSLVQFGGLSPALALVGVVLFVGALAAYTALFAFCVAKMTSRRPTSFQVLGLLPALWVVSEALRGWVLTGLPWLVLGYTSIDSPFAGWAPLMGVMGNSFVLAVLAAALVQLVLFRPNWRVPSLAIVSIALLSMGLGKISWSTDTERLLNVALIQRNVSLADKWRPGEMDRIRDGYLMASSAVFNADLIVWPEAAIPQMFNSVPESFYSRVLDLSGVLVLGGVEAVSDEEHRGIYNGMMVMPNPHLNQKAQTYRKKHLVPFGEFFPFRPLFGGLMEKLDIPMSNFTRWQDPQAPIEIAGMKFAPSICYEDAFPEEWREVAGESSILINVSEDAWFGDTLAPHQRLEMSRFRALEMARPMIRASNSGLSALIGADGKVDVIAPQFQEAIVEGQVAGQEGLTPYVRWGRWPLYGLMAVIIVFSFVRRRSTAGS